MSTPPSRPRAAEPARPSPWRGSRTTSCWWRSGRTRAVSAGAGEGRPGRAGRGRRACVAIVRGTCRAGSGPGGLGRGRAVRGIGPRRRLTRGRAGSGSASASPRGARARAVASDSPWVGRAPRLGRLPGSSASSEAIVRSRVPRRPRCLPPAAQARRAVSPAQAVGRVQARARRSGDTAPGGGGGAGAGGFQEEMGERRAFLAEGRVRRPASPAGGGQRAACCPSASTRACPRSAPCLRALQRSGSRAQPGHDISNSRGSSARARPCTALCVPDLTPWGSPPSSPGWCPGHSGHSGLGREAGCLVPGPRGGWACCVVGTACGQAGLNPEPAVHPAACQSPPGTQASLLLACWALRPADPPQGPPTLDSLPRSAPGCLNAPLTPCRWGACLLLRRWSSHGRNHSAHGGRTVSGVQARGVHGTQGARLAPVRGLGWVLGRGCVCRAGLEADGAEGGGGRARGGRDRADGVTADVGRGGRI